LAILTTAAVYMATALIVHNLGPVKEVVDVAGIDLTLMNKVVKAVVTATDVIAICVLVVAFFARGIAREWVCGTAVAEGGGRVRPCCFRVLQFMIAESFPRLLSLLVLVLLVVYIALVACFTVLVIACYVAQLVCRSPELADLLGQIHDAVRLAEQLAAFRPTRVDSPLPYADPRADQAAASANAAQDQVSANAAQLELIANQASSAVDMVAQACQAVHQDAVHKSVLMLGGATAMCLALGLLMMSLGGSISFNYMERKYGAMREEEEVEQEEEEKQARAMKERELATANSTQIAPV